MKIKPYLISVEFDNDIEHIDEDRTLARKLASMRLIGRYKPILAIGP